MAVPTSTQGLLDDVKKVTDDDALVIDALRAKISTQMSQADVDNVDGQLTSIRDHLKAIGTDPNNPTPPAPPLVGASKAASTKPGPQVKRS